MNNPAVLDRSPCVRNCCLDDDDTCLGCFRSLDEIKDWSNADAPRRKDILHNALRRKQAHAARFGGP